MRDNCLISSFYIKPQLPRGSASWLSIVLYRLSTSNHNCLGAQLRGYLLSYIVFLHQTTTTSEFGDCTVVLSYIVFLHQTTTGSCPQAAASHCLISSFYIKPQHVCKPLYKMDIVLYRLSTSNHNLTYIFF